MLPSEIGCTAKYLPSEMAVASAETAIKQNPVNRPANGPDASTGLILPPANLAVLTSRYWGVKGVKLGVGFMEQVTVALANLILKYANRWSEFGNVEFYLTKTDPQIRVTLAGEGYWSYLGTDILHIPKGEPTMCLSGWHLNMPESENDRVIPHEFGHSMGFPHEHMRKAIIDLLDPQKTISYFGQTQGWSPAMVMNQVLKPLSEDSIMGTKDADETSIMTYRLPGLITKSGRAIPGGDKIAPQDAEFVGRIYPKTNVPVPPPQPPGGSNQFSQRFDIEKKIMAVSMPPGWRVVKEGATTTSGDDSMSEELPAATLTSLADELQAALPATGISLDEAKQGAVGGVVGKVLELIAALRAGDYAAAGPIFLLLLQMLLGSTASDGGLQFQQGAAAAGINWSRLVGVLAKLLPLLLGA